jgi:hypothetical protein
VRSVRCKKVKEAMEKVEGAAKTGAEDEEADEDLVPVEEENAVLSTISVEYEPLGVHR